jgi:hypothetical protein
MGSNGVPPSDSGALETTLVAPARIFANTSVDPIHNIQDLEESGCEYHTSATQIGEMTSPNKFQTEAQVKTNSGYSTRGPSEANRGTEAKLARSASYLHTLELKAAGLRLPRKLCVHSAMARGTNSRPVFKPCNGDLVNRDEMDILTRLMRRD